MTANIEQLPEITDAEMRERLAGTRDYTLMILRTTPKTFIDEGRPVIWEHGRRNMALRAAGALAIVCPVTDGGDVAGIGIFPAPLDEVRGIMEKDPAVQAGVLSYELHPVRGFPGDSLPMSGRRRAKAGGGRPSSRHLLPDAEIDRGVAFGDLIRAWWPSRGRLPS